MHVYSHFIILLHSAYKLCCVVSKDIEFIFLYHWYFSNQIKCISYKAGRESVKSLIRLSQGKCWHVGCYKKNADYTNWALSHIYTPCCNEPLREFHTLHLDSNWKNTTSIHEWADIERKHKNWDALAAITLTLMFCQHITAYLDNKLFSMVFFAALLARVSTWYIYLQR